MGEGCKLSTNEQFPPIIELNVGGVKYSTTLLTLTKRTDTMLATMFSGKFGTQKDQEGRYFIDADGEMFCHILRFLRYDEVPPFSLREKVYKDACYFGINDLINILENRPPLIGAKMREKFLNRIPGYTEFVENLIKHATHLEQLQFDSATSKVTVVLFRHPVSVELSSYDKDHQCFQKTKEYTKDVTRIPLVSYGPWSMDLDADAIMKIVLSDLDERKFVCNYFIHGACHYKCTVPREARASFGGERHVQCPKVMFTINFHWCRM